MIRITSKWMATAACAAAIGLSTLAGGCGGKMSAEQKQDAMMKAPGDIIETATGKDMEDVTTVVELIKVAGLVDTLKSTSMPPAPFTVFAPTNKAFEALGQSACDDLKKPENREKLKAILLYHVHPGQAILAADASTMQLTTADAGKMLNVSVNGGSVMVNDAKVVKADIICKNGVIHWVDKVLMPPTVDMSTMPMQGMQGMNHGM